MNIKEVESQIARNLSGELRDSLNKVGYTVPENCHPRVSLLDANGRKKRSNASADNWSPESGLIEIRLEPVLQKHKQLGPEIPRQAENPSRAQAQNLPKGAADSDSYLPPAE